MGSTLVFAVGFLLAFAVSKPSSADVQGLQWEGGGYTQVAPISHAVCHYGTTSPLSPMANALCPNLWLKEL